MKPLKIGVMSFAHVHAGGYAYMLNSMPDVEVAASDEDYPQRPQTESGGAQFAKDLGIDTYFDTYQELLDWGPDAVVICAENSKHRELTERAAAAGVNVLCEKPIATSVEDGQAMVDACREAGVQLMIAYPVRFSAAFNRLQRDYDDGKLGEAVAVSGTNNGGVPVSRRAWFGEKELAGGGAITDHTVHVADLLDSLFNGSAAKEVYAVSNHMIRADETDLETGGLVSITYENGVIATIDASWSKPVGYPTWGGLTLQVVGTGGIADIDAFGQRVDGFSAVTGKTLWHGFDPNSDKTLLRAFIDAVRSGNPAQPDGESGLRTMRIVQAAYESLESGQPVTL
ncbi:Gfo/Idh/MocA family protein [Haematomicrobium sanguinis]|uniref:Gfo/Idh/MocA family protein n=1 Tax=Haematomicrobium sanguinis TaxID=479106 RepID=UPI00054E12B6|nr:Gfo/Idh/MocA family oxidoreductase [Haematomicrobium sanguinis]